MSYPPSNRAHSPSSDPFDEYDRSAQPPPQFDYSQPYSRTPTPAHRYQLSDSGTAPYGGHLAAPSTYSLADDQEKESYLGDPYNDEEAENRPLTLGAQSAYTEQFDEGYDPSQYTLPSSSGNRTPNRGLTRRETSAEAWGQRQRVNPRRAQTMKVPLTKGNFIAEYPVPTAVRNANEASGLEGGPTEFSHMRYTAACVDPDDFTAENGYTLRTNDYNRETDLLVCITAYNENKLLLTRTLHGLMLNIRDMVKGKFSEFAKLSSGGAENGKVGDAWKRVVVCLVFDGIEPADKASLDVLATIGLYQDGVMKKSVDAKETVAHIFEYTTSLSMSSKLALVEPHANDPNNLVPVQMIFCLKQKNAKKINSHRWLFNALGRQLNPDVVVLLDAGTKPGRRSIFLLWQAFHYNKHLGGACGEIHAMLGKGGRKLINPLVAAQNFEYKMSNILDKPTESSFGYVSVLPGAFSAYRYRAIQGRPLDQYFKGDHTTKGTEGMGIWTLNMYLAEDRILCFELVAKANARWVLGYVKPALGETDVPESAAELIGQRRRWLNGSFAAGVYSLAHFPRLYKTDHGVVRLFFLHIQAIFGVVNLVMSTLQLGNFYLTFSIIVDIVAESLFNPKGIESQDPATIACWSGSFLENTTGTQFNYLGQINSIFKIIYLAFLALQVILALGNRPKSEKLTYTISIVVYAFFAAYLIANTIILTIKAFCPISTLLATTNMNAFSVYFSGTFAPIFAGIAGTFGVYVISSIIYLDPWHILHSMLSYLLIAPAFTNILNVYAFCNLHDVSWGTKGSDKAEALPAANSKKDGKGRAAVVEVQTVVQEDVDSNFKATVMRAVTQFDETQEIEKPTIDDLNKTFRTRFLTTWLGINGVLAIAITRLGPSVQVRYFQAILWITFGLSVVRFLGFIWYMVGESVFRLARLFGRRSSKRN